MFTKIKCIILLFFLNIFIRKTDNLCEAICVSHGALKTDDNLCGKGCKSEPAISQSVARDNQENGAKRLAVLFPLRERSLFID